MSPERRPSEGFDTFYFSNGFGVNFEYLLNSTTQLEKPTDLKMIFFPFNNV